MDILDMILGAEMANEYTDSQRLAHEEVEQVTLFPKKEIILESNDEFGGLLVWQSETIENTQLKIFKFLAQHKNAIFVVNVNGQVYEYVWTDNMMGDGGIITIGNQAIMGAGDDAGDPFLFVISPEGTGFVYENPNSIANMSITASMTIKSETVHKIDPKFIPGAYEKTVLFNGKPTKLDLTSIGLGYAYMLSDEDILSLAYGQNVYFEYTLANGVTAHGVLEKYNMVDGLGIPAVFDNDGTLTLLYSAPLGGTGVSFNYADVGEVANLKLWTEYSENSTYYITSPDYANVVPNSPFFFRFEEHKAELAFRSGRALMRQGSIRWTPLSTQKVYFEDKLCLRFTIADDCAYADVVCKEFYFYDGVLQNVQKVQIAK